MADNEARNDRRFDAAFPLKVRSRDLAAPIESSTVNVGASGLYFLLPYELKPGLEIACELLVPVPSAGSSIPIHLTARVIRCEPCHGMVGIAVEFLRNPSGTLARDHTAA